MFDLNETISPSKDTEVKEILVSNQLRFEKEYEEVKDYFDNLNNQISKIKDFMKSDKFNEILEIQKINLIDELRLKENHVKHTKDYLNMLESRLHLKKKINIHN